MGAAIGTVRLAIWTILGVCAFSALERPLLGQEEAFCSDDSWGPDQLSVKVWPPEPILNHSPTYWIDVFPNPNGMGYEAIITDDNGSVSVMNYATFQQAAQTVDRYCPDGLHFPLPHHSQAPVGTPTGQAALGLIGVDLNGDGVPDLVVVSAGTVTATLLNPDYSVLSSSVYPVDPNAVNVIAADFNGDGVPDLAVTDSYYDATGGSVQILIGKGDGTFQAAQNVKAGSGPSAIVAADFNGDGKTDLAVGDADLGTVLILLGNGNGTFQAPASYTVGRMPQSMVAADFNGDGTLDLAVLNAGSLNVSVLLGNAGGTFQMAVNSPGGATTSGEGYLTYADFNHDGKLDLAIAYSSSNCIALLLGDGNGTFQAARNYVAANQPVSLGIVPYQDGSFAFLTDDALTSNVIEEVSPGDGTLSAPPLHQLNGSLAAIATADVNGDHQQDIVTISDTRQSLTVLLGDGDGGFTAVPPQPLQSQTAGTTPLGLAIGDLNGDKNADLVVVNNSPQSAGTIGVLLGNGNGTFGQQTEFAAGNNPGGLVLADLNGDGNLDAVVVSNAYPAAGPAAVLVFIGRGDGTFKPAVSYALGSACEAAISVGDFTGDGKLDLAVANATGCSASSTGTPSSVLVLPGVGDGAFKTAISSAAGITFQGSPVAGDFNGDGRLDLAGPSQVNGTSGIQTVLGNGDGTFRAGPFVATNLSGTLLTADVNGDGLLDLINTACCGLTDSTHLLGNGAGSFQSEVHITAGPSPVGAALADFNGDGQPDLAYAGRPGFVAALLNGFPTLVTAPASVTLSPSQQQQFTVTGYFGASTKVTWSLDPPVGTISSSGMYTAPASIVSQQTVTVIANNTATSTITLTPLQYTLTTAASPAAGGTVTPATGTTYVPGTVVPITAAPASGYQFTGWTGPVASATSASTTVTMNAAETVTANFTAIGHPAFFSGEDFLSGIVYYLQFPASNLFGYYEYLSSSILYHFDMGYEAFIPGSGNQIYFYDFASSHWWYTSSSLFPYLYDFTLNTFIYYFPDTTKPGHYTTNPRYFSNLTTQQILTM